MFSAAPYSRRAYEFAEDLGIALFVFDPLGVITPTSPAATEMLQRAQAQAAAERAAVADASQPWSAERITQGSHRGFPVRSRSYGSSPPQVLWWREAGDPRRKIKYGIVAFTAWLFFAVPFGVAISQGIGSAFEVGKGWVPVVFMAPFSLMSVVGATLIVRAIRRRRSGKQTMGTVASRSA